MTRVAPHDAVLAFQSLELLEQNVVACANIASKHALLPISRAA